MNVHLPEHHAVHEPWSDDVINAAFWIWAAAMGGMVALTCWLFSFPLG